MFGIAFSPHPGYGQIWPKLPKHKISYILTNIHCSNFKLRTAYQNTRSNHFMKFSAKVFGMAFSPNPGYGQVWPKLALDNAFTLQTINLLLTEWEISTQISNRRLKISFVVESFSLLCMSVATLNKKVHQLEYKNVLVCESTRFCSHKAQTLNKLCHLWSFLI